MTRKTGGRSGARRLAEALAIRCAVLPAPLRSAGTLAGGGGGGGGLAWARQELASILAHVRGGFLVRTVGKGDVLGNLMLVRAAHEFAAAAGTSPDLTDADRRSHLEFAATALLPVCQRVVQEFVSDQGMDGVWMDNSGILAGVLRRGRKNAALAAPLRLNALWYSALEVTGLALRGLTPMGADRAGGAGARDASGDHFERLAGRFRRAFNKDFWCEDHQRICPQELRTAGPDHGGLPDAEQLLLMILPASPLPRTKQAGILAQIQARGLGPLGVWVRGPAQELVESPLHRAWLAQALWNAAENAPQRQQAVLVARPLEALRAAALGAGVHAHYRDGKPLDPAIDPVATAEVLATLERLARA